MKYPNNGNGKILEFRYSPEFIELGWASLTWDHEIDLDNPERVRESRAGLFQFSAYVLDPYPNGFSRP